MGLRGRLLQDGRHGALLAHDQLHWTIEADAGTLQEATVHAHPAANYAAVLEHTRLTDDQTGVLRHVQLTVLEQAVHLHLGAALETELGILEDVPRPHVAAQALLFAVFTAARVLQEFLQRDPAAAI